MRRCSSYLASLLLGLSLSACTRHPPEHPDALQVRLDQPSADGACDMLPAPQGRGQVCLSRQVIINANDITKATWSFDAGGRPQILLQLSDTGRSAIARVTAENIRRQMAVVVNGQIVILATITAPVDVPNLSIAGNFTVEEAQTLTNRIKVAIGE